MAQRVRVLSRMTHSALGVLAIPAERRVGLSHQAKGPATIGGLDRQRHREGLDRH